MRTRHVVTGIAVVAVCVGVTVGARKLVDVRARARQARTWADARACLLGPPLEAGETVRERVNRLRYARSGDPPKRLKSGIDGFVHEPSWPEICADSVTAVMNLRGAPPSMTSAANALASHLDDIKASQSTRTWKALDPTLVDALVAATASLDTVPAKDPPKRDLSPRPMLDTPKIAELAPKLEGVAMLHYQSRDEQPLDHLDLFGVGARACSIVASGERPLASLRCGPSKEVDHRPTRRAADGSTLQFRTIPSPNKKPAKAGDAPTPSPPSSTALFRTVGEHSDMLMRFEGSEYQAFFAGGAAVWLDGDSWKTQPLLGEKPWLGPESTLGAEKRPSLATCRAPKRTVVAVASNYDWNKGRGQGEVLGGPSLFAATDGALSPLATIPKSEESEGRRTRVSFGPSSLSCSDDDVRVATSRVTWNDDLIPDEEAIRWTCREGHCDEQRVKLGRLDPLMWFTGGNWTSDPDGMEAPTVVDLGAKTLLLFRSHRALWARVAPFAELDRAPDQIIAGDDDPFEIDFQYDTIFTRDRVAIVLLVIRQKTNESNLVLRADASGDLRVLDPVVD